MLQYYYYDSRTNDPRQKSAGEKGQSEQSEESSLVFVGQVVTIQPANHFCATVGQKQGVEQGQTKLDVHRVIRHWTYL